MVVSQDLSYEKDYELMASHAQQIEDSAALRALPMPRHTALSQARVVSVKTW